MPETTFRGHVVRIERESDGNVEFLRFDAALNTRDMKTLEECLEETYLDDPTYAKALEAFKARTGKTGMPCAAPYLCDIKLA